MRLTRRAGQGDLARLLELYRHLNAGAPKLAADHAMRIFDEILTERNAALFVSLVGDTMVASAYLVTAPNLMRGGAPHGFLDERRHPRRASPPGPRPGHHRRGAAGSLAARLPPGAVGHRPRQGRIRMVHDFSTAVAGSKRRQDGVRGAHGLRS